MKLYLLVVEDGGGESLKGPYKNETTRLQAAKKYHDQQALAIVGLQSTRPITFSLFSNGELDGDVSSAAETKSGEMI